MQKTSTMALPSEPPRSFRLYVTHVDAEGHFLKISGQLDQQSSLMVESLFKAACENLEKGVGAVPPAAIQDGVICAAKYKDGTYYRAKVISTTNLATGLVGVHFIDYGNKDIISLSTIRFLDNYDPMFLKLRGQATDYYLARVLNPSGRWEEPLLLKLQSLLCYAEYSATVEAQTRLPLISVQFKGNDLSTHLVSIRFGVAIPLAKQEALLLQMSGDNQQPANWQPNYLNEAPSYTEHVPFLINHNFPSNPASAMRLQQNMAMPFNGNLPPPSSLVSHRLLVNKASRNPVNLRAPARQPHLPTAPPSVLPGTPPAHPQVQSKPTSPKKSATYKSRLLEVGSQHKVFVSFAEEGPELFAVQLATDAKKLQDMMDDINRRPHSSLAEPPMIGTVCLGRMSGDRIICRAIVMNLSGSQCKLFFVDFGDTEMVSYYDIFDIPEEFVKPNVFAMRFCLSVVKKLEKGPHLNEIFKQLVNGKVLTLKVVAPEGPPLIQYGELYLENKNVLELLMANMKDKLQFKRLEMLTLGAKKSVLVSYVDSCIKFYVQLSDNIDDLNAVMDAVKVHCENSSSPGDLPVGAACCARFPDDDNWYRARVRDTRGSKVVVVYVDYGNEQEVEVKDLRTITPELIRFPAQAMKCALKGFENKPVETKTSNQLEMLALEKTLMAHIVGVLSSDTMLVTLIDDTVNPPLDVARRMNQLSQPRSSHEIKATTPVRKDAPEIVSSPEGSVPDDGRKKSFRREKSFKEERRPPREPAEDFAQRGGSFRSRDKENFDRSGPGRHSEKFAGRPDRGDKRPGSKPWENNTIPPAPPADDEWGEAPPPRANNRDNRDRRKPRGEQQEKAGPKGWKSKEPGVGKRLRQAAEAASADTQRPSVQDRLRRDNKYNNQQDEPGERRTDDWGNRTGNERRDRPERRDYRDNRGDRDNRDNRGDRRDNRGEKRDNWGEKKESWGEKKDNWGEKKDNWGEKKNNLGEKKDWGDKKRESRGDRGGKSNFTPRDRADRADRSFGSDGDRRSVRSGDSGRAPPYKTRSKFTQVQYRTLEAPHPLEESFSEPQVEVGEQHEIAVTWIISPANFYTQILSLQPKFLDMMHRIPELYKGVKSYSGIVPVGASVLARYPADGVLYRATVVEVKPFSKFIVQYVDFGNKQQVDARDIWQLEKSLVELPKMAVCCSLSGVEPAGGQWRSGADLDLCFSAPRYQCVFQSYHEGMYSVSLWNNGASVADMLVEKQLATLTDQHSAVTLKDEAIDLTIIVGQQILCKVTHVESFEKFYVQLDLDKAALVEKAIAEFDATQLTPLATDSLTDGVHCTLKHGGKIYRAILEDVSDTANIKAVLPDYGIKITTTLDNLMILPTELSVYFYQSLECCLNNYTAESKALISLEDLKQRLTGNKFIVYINNVDGISLVSTLYDSITGAKVAIFEPDEGAYDEVVQLCTRAVFNYNFGLAYIAHMENLNEFYLQRATDGDKIAVLLDELFKYYEEGTPEPLTEFEVDGLCAAKSADSNWYRATIVSLEQSKVKVQFSDYGNTETLPKDALKKLDPKFYEPCALALVASLGLVALKEDALDKLKEWTNEKEVQVTLAFGTDGWLASLHLEGVDLSMKLVNEKLATPQIAGAPSEEPKQEPPTEEPVSLPQGCTQVYISHIDTPGHFWLQMVDKVDKIDEIQATLQANADSYPNIENRELGTLCVAKYLADDQWYRAEILDSDSDITTVRFIDYGNTDVLDNQPGLIKELPAALSGVERYALKASVNAVPTGTGQWSEPAADHFTRLVGDLSAPVDALIVLKDVTTYVDIFVHGQNLTDKLVSEGHASRAEDTDCGDLPSCFASHVNSPSEFWIQLESATPELQAMEAAMVDAENFPELVDKEEGVICAAKYPEDGAWYRAQVIVDGSEGTEVLFMDYGNASIANELRNLPDELKVKPALSRKCALQKPRDIKTWSRKSEIKFNELAAEGATIFNVQFIASGDISIVDLYLEGRSVTEELVGLCEELMGASEGVAASERPAPLGQDLLVSGRICFVNSCHEFYVHLDDTIAHLDKISDKLEAAPEFETVAELKVGAMCAAFWAEDEKWYRSKILEFCDVGYHVQFVDFGNKAKCEEFRQLPEEISVIEPVAKCCRLTGLRDDSATHDLAKNKLDDLALDDTTFQIEFLDSTKEPNLVKLLLSGRDLVSMINEDIANKETNDQTVNTEPSAQIPPAENAQANETEIEPTIDSRAEVREGETDLETSAQEKVSVVEPTTNLETELKEETTDIQTITQANEAEVKSPLDTQAEGNEIITKVEPSSQENVTEVEPTNVQEDAVHTEEKALDKADKVEEDDTESELNTSQPDLNESFNSTHTVIECTSNEAKSDTLSDDAKFDTPENKSFEDTDAFSDEHDKSGEIKSDDTPSDKDISSSTLENSNDTLKTPERDESKESINTDTGYTSSGEHDKSATKESLSPKDSTSPAKTGAKSEVNVSEPKEKSTDNSIKEKKVDLNATI